MALSTLPAVTGYHFTVAQYDKMIESGIFCEDTRVELIDGEVIRLAPMGSLHAFAVGRSFLLFTNRFQDVAIVTSQTPVVLGEHSEPQPNLMLLRPRSDSYRRALPIPADVLLFVELSDSTLTFDRRVKVPLYARAGIPEVWLVDLDGETLTVYLDPSPSGYGVSRTVRRGDSLAPLAFPGRQIAVSELFG